MNKVGIELDVETGGFISGLASAGMAVDALSKKMEEAKAKGTPEGNEEYVRLQIQRDALKASASSLNKSTQNLFNAPHLQTTAANGMPAVKFDSESGQLFKDFNKNIKSLNELMVEQLNKDDYNGAWNTLSQIQQEERKYKKAVDEATAPAGSRSVQDTIKAIGIDKIATAINSGFSAWAGSLNRSGIIKQYGSGDILGGQISEERRKANMYGGLAQAGGGIAGTIFGLTVGAALGGPMVWGTIGAQLGQAIKTALGIKPDLDENEAAYAGLWQQRSADAMNLAALMGRDAVTGDRNMVRETFKESADASAKFGYSAEEGMEMIGQAVRQGLNGDKAREVTEQVFQYERSTGADRGTLSSVANMAARYGLGADPLKTGWGGLGASGMSSGQFTEYLRATGRILEDGINKGFIRSSEQVAQNLSLIAHIGGDNKTWQGEGGARRYQSMSAGLENAVGLQSSTDIHVYRAARQILEKQGKSTSWVDVNRLVEQGLGGKEGTELQYRTWAMDYNAEGGGREGFVSRQVQRGQTYDAAIKMWDHFAPTFKEMGGRH